MGLTNSEIKDECDEIFKVIKDSHERLEKIREECKHEDTKIEPYSWRPGVIQDAVICSYCKKFLEYNYPY